MNSKRIVYALAFVSAILFLWEGVRFYQFERERDLAFEQVGIETTKALKDTLNKLLEGVIAEGNQLAQQFGGNNFAEQEILSLIRNSAESVSGLQGVTACYEPFRFDESRRLFCPYYNKGDASYLQVEDSYDYTIPAPGTEWYVGVRENGASWTEPYFAKAAQDWYVDYGVPFYYTKGDRKGEVRGTITMSFVASKLKDIIHSLSVGRTGFSMITSPEGKLLAHPQDEYVGIQDVDFLLEKGWNKELELGFNAIKERKTTQLEFYDVKKADHALMVIDKIAATNWGLGLVFYKNDVLADKQARNRFIVRCSLLLSFLIVFLVASYFIKDYLDETEVWQLSFIATALLLFLISLVAYLQHERERTGDEDQSIPVVNNNALSNVLYGIDQRARNRKVPIAQRVPTGVFVNRLKFEDSYNLSVGGKVWQKYPIEIVDQVTTGFQFPQMSPFAEASYIEEIYRDTILDQLSEKQFLLLGYEYRVTLTLNFKYSDYPFDKRNISIQLQPIQNQDRLVFVPDLESYTNTNPSSKSGLNPDIQVSGNQILETYFNYSIDTYDADFGYGDKSLYEGVATLHYNINLKRNLLNAFVTYLIPVVVSLLMMFILIYAVRKTAERQGIIESMAAFFFVLIFSHIDMRKEIETADLIYFEYFYFITYLMVILSTANLVVYTKDRSAIFDKYDNLYFKAAYFPLFLFLIAIVTLVKFY